jgi:hypothetical protein
MNRQEIEQKMDALARGIITTLTTRKSQKRFFNWLGGLGRWIIEGVLEAASRFEVQCVARIEYRIHNPVTYASIQTIRCLLVAK